MSNQVSRDSDASHCSSAMPRKDGVYVNGKNIGHIRWIWYPEFSSLRGELYVHLECKSDDAVGDSVELVIASDGAECSLADCVLHRRFRCADIWVQIYQGTVVEVR